MTRTFITPFSIRLLALLTIVASSVVSVHAGDITNGSFESPALSSPSRVDISNLHDWTASGGFLLLERGVNTTSNLAASDGEQFVSFGHSSRFNGRLFQSFDTTIGDSYTVTFDVTSIQGAATQTLRASAFDDIANMSLAFTDSTVNQQNVWMAGTTLVFTATSATTRLEFEDTVGSGSANIALDNVKVTHISSNSPPIAVASIVVDGEDLGDFVELPCEGHHGVAVTLDGSESFDPDGDELDFEWSVAEDSGILIVGPTDAETEAFFPVGVHVVTLTVYDLDGDGERKGTLDIATVTVVVVDDTPPLAMVTTDLAALWPPNNKMVPVMIHVEASDACTDPDNLLIECVITSSQPDDSDGTGEHVGDVDGEDGFLAPVPVDLLNLGGGLYAALVSLRAERDGADKAGRVYSIHLEVIDGAGNVGQASTLVVVPHNGRTN